MEALQGVLSNMKVDVLKEPRGFMKLLQFLFTICAFATTTSFSSSLVLTVPCQNQNVSVTVPIEYNFKLNEYNGYVCDGKPLFFLQDFSSDCGFFVAVGVLAFLFTIGMLVVYCFFNALYDNNPLLPLADCVVHGIFAVLFLASSSAWANSLNALKTATTQATINKENVILCSDKCIVVEAPNYAKLNISIILGFLNLFLFASNIWFLYKETALFKEKQAAQGGQIPQQTPHI